MADTSERWYRRIDASLTRIDETLERQTEAFDRHAAAFERHAVAFERQSEAFARQEQALALMARGFERNIAALDALTKVLADMSDQIRANTQAVLRLLDRFGNGGELPAH
jgi:methyl-accepting chemotaxis protein